MRQTKDLNHALERFAQSQARGHGSGPYDSRRVKREGMVQGLRHGTGPPLYRRCNNSLDRMHPVFCFVKDNRLWTLEDFVRDFHVFQSVFFVDLPADLGVEIVE